LKSGYDKSDFNDKDKGGENLVGCRRLLTHKIQIGVYIMILFQAQIEEHQRLAEHYRELAAKREAQAAGLLATEKQVSAAVQTLLDIKEKLDADAAATLQSAILGLFNDGSGDDGGNEPELPDPEPDDSGDDSNFEVLYLNGETGDCLTTNDFADEPDEESAEESQEHEESTEEEIVTSGEAMSHPKNSAIAYSSDTLGKLTVFIGFAKKSIAKSWQRFIEPMAISTEIREPRILTGFKWELRNYGLSMPQLSKLAECDFTECHRTEVASATPPAPLYRFQPPAIQIGSKVTKPNSSEVFEATSPASNKVFFAKSTVTGDRKLFSIEDVNILHEPLPEGSPQYATVLLAECPWKGEKLQIVVEGEGGYTLATPKGTYWYRRDCVELFDERIEEIADPTEPEKESVSVLGVGDIVEIVSDRYPQFLDQIGTVEDISSDADTPIRVRSSRGIKPYHRFDLKLISKALPFSPESDKELVAAGSELEF
jgi:hypothetical protein